MANTEETPVYKVALRLVVLRHHIFPWCAYVTALGSRQTLVSASPPPFHSHIY